MTKRLHTAFQSLSLNVGYTACWVTNLQRRVGCHAEHPRVRLITVALTLVEN